MNTPDEPRPLSAPDLERVVLGCFLLHDEPPRELDEIDESLFSTHEHRIVWRAIESRIETTHRVDLTLLAEDLRSAALLERDALEFLLECESAVMSTANLREYASRLRELRDRRELLKRLRENVERAERSATPLDEIRDSLISQLVEIGATAGGCGVIDHAEVSGRFTEQLRARLRGDDQRISTGLVNLDDVVGGLAPGRLTVIAGRPSMGKSSLALNIVRGAVLAGHAALFVALESSAEEIANSWCAIDGDVGNYQLSNTSDLTPTDLERINASLNRMGNDAGGLFVDDDSAQTVESIGARIRRLKRKHPGLRLVVVDHIGLVRGKGQNREQEIAGISSGLRLLAKECDVAMIAVSQLNRGTENRDDRRPRLADLRDSGTIEQDASLILLLFREEYYFPERVDKQGLAEVFVAKHRGGPVGSVELRWDAEHVRFSDWWPEMSYAMPAR
ncbi:MAG: replicative DNA helicase [Planctomycetota bacterium]